MSRSVDLRLLSARRICVIKPSALGDVVQALPLLPVLRRRFPEAHLAWVINRELADLLNGHPHLDEIIPFDRRGSLASGGRLLRKLAAAKFDLVFDLQGLLRTGVMTWATRAPVRIGLETAREGAQLACTITLPGTGLQLPAHARYWRVAEELGLEDASPQTIVHLPPADRGWADSQIARLPRPVVAINPGARWETKRWPAEKFAAVARNVLATTGGSVAIVGSRGEAELAADVSHVLAGEFDARRVLNLCGQTSLKQLAGVLQRVDLLVTNDSGPMHLAAGLGTTVVGVFTCTDPVRSGPPGGQHALVSTGVACAGSYCKTCPKRGRARLACFRELDVDRVWTSVVGQLGRIRRRAAG